MYKKVYRLWLYTWLLLNAYTVSLIHLCYTALHKPAPKPCMYIDTKCYLVTKMYLQFIGYSTKCWELCCLVCGKWKRVVHCLWYSLLITETDMALFLYLQGAWHSYLFRFVADVIISSFSRSYRYWSNRVSDVAALAHAEEQIQEIFFTFHRDFCYPSYFPWCITCCLFKMMVKIVASFIRRHLLTKQFLLHDCVPTITLLERVIRLPVYLTSVCIPWFSTWGT